MFLYYVLAGMGVVFLSAVFLQGVLRLGGCRAGFWNALELVGGVTAVGAAGGYAAYMLNNSVATVLVSVLALGCGYYVFGRIYGEVCKGGKRSLSIYVLQVLLEVFLMVVLFGVVKVWFVAPFYVEGESMYPTLEAGEYVWIDKRSRVFERGDVVVFDPPIPQKPGYMIKRIIGMPGENVALRDGWVYICNGECAKLDEGEYLADKHLGHTCAIGRGCGSVEYNVPEGAYFVMGDNRSGSIDSRFFELEGGSFFVPKENVVGKVK